MRAAQDVTTFPGPDDSSARLGGDVPELSSTPIHPVYLASAIGFAVAAIGAAAVIIAKQKPTFERDLVRVRFAMVTFTGIMVVFIFAAILYAGDKTQGAVVGKDIFEKAVTAMTPLAGVIVGYLFGARASGGGGEPTARKASGVKGSEEG